MGKLEGGKGAGAQADPTPGQVASKGSTNKEQIFPDPQTMGNTPGVRQEEGRPDPRPAQTPFPCLQVRNALGTSLLRIQKQTLMESPSLRSNINGCRPGPGLGEQVGAGPVQALPQGLRALT